MILWLRLVHRVVDVLTCDAIDVSLQSEGRDTFASQDATIISEPPPPPAEESQDHHSDHSADDNAQHDAEDHQDDQASDHSVRVHDAAAAQTQAAQHGGKA